MRKISFTHFVDFVLKAGTPKLTGVKELKENKDNRHSDFYKPLREAIVDMHMQGGDEDELDDFLDTLEHERERRIFPALVAGYRKFLGSRDMAWFDPGSAKYRLGHLKININPELGLVIDGVPHVIKMYFRGEPLTHKRVSIVLNLLNAAIEPADPDTVFAMLDVRNSRLHTLKLPLNPRMDVLLRGEAASFSKMYASV
jgi:hypothetical protein